MPETEAFSISALIKQLSRSQILKLVLILIKVSEDKTGKLASLGIIRGKKKFFLQPHNVLPMLPSAEQNWNLNSAVCTKFRENLKVQGSLD